MLSRLASAIVIVLSLYTCVEATQTVTIAIVGDGPQLEEDSYYQSFVEETTDLLEGEFTLNFEFLAAHWSLESSAALLEEAINDPAVTLILTIGPLSRTAALTIEHPPKSIIVPDLYADYVPAIQAPLFELAEQNIIHTTRGKSLVNDLTSFYELFPFSHLIVIGDAALLDRNYAQKELESAITQFQAGFSSISVTERASDAIEELEQAKGDAVLFLPTWRLNSEQFSQLVVAVNQRGLPSFSLEGEEDVKRGVLATNLPPNFVKRVGRRLALNVQEILLSDEKKDVESGFPSGREMVINATTAKRIDLSPPWEVLLNAVLIDLPPPPEGVELNLLQTVEESLRQNLDLWAERFLVEGGRQLVCRALSELYPQIDSRVFGRIIDADRARAFNGRMPQRSVSGALELRQSIYDDDLWANYQIECETQGAREYRLMTSILDLLLDTSISYLSVLKVAAEEQIAKENLNLTKANLERAYERVASGEANKSEVYRWESELARNRDDLLRVHARLENTETNFNRILNRPLDTPVVIHDISPDDTDLLFNYPQFDHFFRTFANIGLFKEFMLYLARRQSPELKSFNQLIAAQERRVVQTERSFYVPRVTAGVEVSDIFYKDGAGSRFPPGSRGDNLDTTVELDVSYPLYTGGRRAADRNRAKYDLRSVQTDKNAEADRVDQRVINAIDNLVASFRGISFAKRAAESAELNLDIVQESYARGVVSIVDLIDAQNNDLVSKTLSSNAVYDFLIDLATLERSVGRFEFFMSQAERQMLLDDLNGYMSCYQRGKRL